MKCSECEQEIAVNTFKKEIFCMVKDKPTVFQYNDKALFETMLGRFRTWEKQGKDITILDVRDAVYSA